MTRSDLINVLVVSLLIGVFLLPVVKATGFWDMFPATFWILLIILIPVLSVVGMFIAFTIGNRVPILWQFTKFALVGVLNTAVDFGILNLLIVVTSITSGPGLIPLNALSFSAAVVNSYFWNKRWVFVGKAKGNFAVFFIVTLIGLGINSGIVFLIATFVTPFFEISGTLWVNFAKVLATGISLFWNFTGYRVIVFRR